MREVLLLQSNRKSNDMHRPKSRTSLGYGLPLASNKSSDEIMVGSVEIVNLTCGRSEKISTNT